MALYVYMHNKGGYVWDNDDDDDNDVGVDALYEIILPSLSTPSNKPPFEKEVISSPILEIPESKYPRNMGCVAFGSKLYFLGGHGSGRRGISLYGPEVDDDDDTDFTLSDDLVDVDLTHSVYNSNVYVFDTNDRSSGLKECPPMSTGKPTPWTFVADGMIYVIAGSVRRDSYKLFNESINRFERFNPVLETWHVLDDSPLKNLCGCLFTAVFENHHKVVIFGLDYGELFRFVYDFKHDKWESDSTLYIGDQIPYFICHVSDKFCDEDDGCYDVYGFEAHLPGFPIKLGPLKDPKHLNNLCPLQEISIVDTPLAWDSIDPKVKDWTRNAFFRCMGFHPVYTIHHLGDGYFCHVMTGRDCSVAKPLSNCRHTYRVSVIIFKELSSEDKHMPLSFEAKLVHIQDYEIKMASHASFQFADVFFVVPGN